MSLQRSHLFLGIGTVIVFLGTGVFMLVNFPGLYEENESVRYLFRANHVYLLFSGLLNIVLGLHLMMSVERWKFLLQRTGS